MKSEPEAFSIDDLERKGKEAWDGVRNYQARNYLRDGMQVGDLVLFYHSNAKPSGIAGIARIVSPPRPDPTQFDPQEGHFDPDSSPDSPRWWLVDVEFLRKFPHLISLTELKSHPALAQLEVLRKGQRLSVMPVRPQEFHYIESLAFS